VPTISSARSPFSQPEPHQNRHVAESFGVDAERYDRTRPRYPDAVVSRIVAAGPGREVLDVGIGTGIAARQFRAAGCTVSGVEPDERMAQVARRDGTEVDVTTFEAWDPGGRRFDAVIAGQAWHWVDPVAGAAKAARVLRPGGRLAVFWNAAQPSPDAAEAFAAVYAQLMPDLPVYRKDSADRDAYGVFCAAAADGMRQAGAFGEPERWQVDWDQPYTTREWLEVLPTQGIHTRLPAETLQELLDRFGAAVDSLGGGFTMHYATVVVTAARLGT
jgi:SAM-dependent methyltransferase